MRRTAFLTLAFLAASGWQAMAQQPQQPPAAAEPPPQLVPAHCTLTKAMLCKEGGCTASETFGDLKLPTKVSLDFNRRVMLGVGPDGFASASGIDHFAVAGPELIGYGIDRGTSWMVHADSSDNTVTIAVSSDHTILNAFGTCVAAE
jgi:hypothetical protein